VISDEAPAKTYSRVERNLLQTLLERLAKVACAMRRRRGRERFLDAYLFLACQQPAALKTGSDLTLCKKEKACTLRFPRGAKGRVLPLSERLLKELENYWRAQRQGKSRS
jgi:hypothetical protein